MVTGFDLFWIIANTPPPPLSANARFAFISIAAVDLCLVGGHGKWGVAGVEIDRRARCFGCGDRPSRIHSLMSRDCTVCRIPSAWGVVPRMISGSVIRTPPRLQGVGTNSPYFYLSAGE